jgi:hypothetical protein
MDALRLRMIGSSNGPVTRIGGLAIRLGGLICGGVNRRGGVGTRSIFWTSASVTGTTSENPLEFRLTTGDDILVCCAKGAAGGGGGGGGTVAARVALSGNRCTGVLSIGETSVTGVSFVMAGVAIRVVGGKGSRPAQKGSTGVNADMAIGVELADRDGPVTPWKKRLTLEMMFDGDVV